MKLYETLEKQLKKESDFVTDKGELKKWVVISKAQNHDAELIELLLANQELKTRFFFDVKGVLVFNQSLFVQFLEQKNYLNDSYTQCKNKVGLKIDDKYLKPRNEVYLVWPFKDCVLEGGQTKEEQKGEEIFFNEILAQDEITQLFEPKVLTNARYYTKEGEKPFDKFHRDAGVNRKRGLPEDTITDNLIIKGNNLLACNSLKKEFAGKVRLIYLDPPYNTGSDSFNYNDRFTRSTWLTFMKNRLETAKELLMDSGSIYINIDFNQVHYLKILMDEVFGEENFQREIIWRIGWLSGYKTSAKNYIRNHDTILFYSKNPALLHFNKKYTNIEDYQVRFNYKIKKEIIEKLLKYNINKKEANNFLDYISTVGLPERYPLEDTWNSSVYDKLNSIAVVSYSGEKVSKMLGRDEVKGQKPEKLLQRIIEVSSDENDIILDFHLGTGTTCAVANKLNRQYIGIEQIDYQIETAVLRLKKVIEGTDQSGISKSINWKGGSSFIYLDLKKYNETFIEQIQKAKDTNTLLKIWKEMKNHSFLNYNVDLKEQEEQLEKFQTFSLNEQKQQLCEILDKNQLYVNYSSLNDKDFACTDAEKKLTKDFYQITDRKQ